MTVWDLSHGQRAALTRLERTFTRESDRRLRGPTAAKLAKLGLIERRSIYDILEEFEFPNPRSGPMFWLARLTPQGDALRRQLPGQS